MHLTLLLVHFTVKKIMLSLATMKHNIKHTCTSRHITVIVDRTLIRIYRKMSLPFGGENEVTEVH